MNPRKRKKVERAMVRWGYAAASDGRKGGPVIIGISSRRFQIAKPAADRLREVRKLARGRAGR